MMELEMTMIQQLGIDNWTVDDRLTLVHEIWDSIGESVANSQPPDEVCAELDRRIAELDANPDDVYTWDEIKEFVRRKR